MQLAELEEIAEDAAASGVIRGATLLRLMACYGGRTDPDPDPEQSYNTDGLLPYITDRARIALLEKTLKPCPCGGTMQILELATGDALVCSNSSECLTFIGGEVTRLVRQWNDPY
ncbi:MAG: hypothetical protein ACNA8H_12400 [Anaerolineales bacterium]